MSMQALKRALKKVLDGKAANTGIFEVLKCRSAIDGRCGAHQWSLTPILLPQTKLALKYNQINTSWG